MRLGRQDRGEESRVFQPGVLKMKEMGFREGGWDGYHEGDVIRGGTQARGERRVGELGAEFSVDKCSIQASQGGRIHLAAPSVKPIQQREFNKGEFVKETIEPIGQRPIESCCILSAGERVRL
jgi:hypothetical protein